ncbi:MAG: hypothetical protein EOL95_09815 [Bacteroidia bacterium]|nr:hypothetical protein [Bacteroidia bacterium]
MLQVIKLNSTNNADLGNSPAALSRKDGVIYINGPYFDKFTDFQKKFIVLHEMGHHYLNTDNEIKADAYAFAHLAGTEFRSLKQAVATIEKTLVDGNSTKAERSRCIRMMAYKWDAEHGNEKAAEEYCRLQDMCGWSFAIGGVEIFSGTNTGEQKALAEADYILQQSKELEATTTDRSNTLKSVQGEKKLSLIIESVIVLLAIGGIIWMIKDDLK